MTLFCVLSIEYDCKCFHSVSPQFRLQGENLAERPEDVFVVSQTSEPVVTDSDGKLHKYLLLIKKLPNANILNWSIEVKSVKED